MKLFVNRIISSVLLIGSGMCAVVNAAQSSQTPGIASSSMSSSLSSSLSSSTQSLDLSTRTQQSYSINLMWINREKNLNQPYIHSSKDEESLNKNFLDHIFKWAVANKGSVVNVWFDGALIAAEAIANTQQSIEKRKKSFAQDTMAQICLRDVRTIPKVTENSDVFSEKIPVYFRVDLLRVIIALHELANDKNPTSWVYGDLDMEPLSAEELFDSETLQNLKQYGIVMAANAKDYFENGFQIISNENEHLLEAISLVLIDVNIQRACNALSGKFFDSRYYLPMQALQEIVYRSYDVMFKYFSSLEGHEKLQVLRKSNPVVYDDYDKGRDGLKPFGLRHMHNFDVQTKFLTNNSLRFPAKEYVILRFIPNSKNLFWAFWQKIFGQRPRKIPTKQVALPGSRIIGYRDPLFDSSHPDYVAASKEDQFSIDDSEAW